MNVGMVSSTVQIRPVIQQDFSELRKLMGEYIVDFYKQPEPNEDDLVGLIQQLIDNPSSGHQFVAEEDGELLSFTTLYFTFDTLKVKKLAILNDLFVVPNIRRKKVGYKLFSASMDYARENNFSAMTWVTAKDNLTAQALYNRMGGQHSKWLAYEINF